MGLMSIAMYVTATEVFLISLPLTKCERNDVKQSRLAVSIHHVQGNICDKKTCGVNLRNKALISHWSLCCNTEDKEKETAK